MENCFLFCTSVLSQIVQSDADRKDCFSAIFDSENSGLKWWRKWKIVFCFLPPDNRQNSRKNNVSNKLSGFFSYDIWLVQNAKKLSVLYHIAMVIIGK